VLPLVFREIPDDLESHTVWQDAKTSVYDRIQEHCESRSLEYRPVRTFVKGLAKEVIRLRQEMQDSIEAYGRFCSSTSDDYLLVALDKFSHALLKSNRFLDDGTWLERPTVADLLDRVRSNRCSTTFLLGHAGVGKSSILATAAANFISSGNVILAIKADALTFPCNSLRDVELAICPSLLPNRTLLRELRLIARTRPVVVIFDQLDALSRLSDIHSERLHVLLTFIQQFRGVQGIHVMISCRNTEMADLRLSAKLPVDLTPDVVLQVQPLDRKQVEDLLISRDIVISGIPDSCIEDLRVPVNLMDFLSDPNGFLSRWRESSS
jgi:hypothetical protein